MTLTSEDLQAISGIVSGVVSGLLEPIYQRLDRLEERMDRLEERMDRLEERMDRLEERQNRTEARFDRVEENQKVIMFRQNHMSRKLEDLQLDFKVVQRDIGRKVHDLDDQMETVIVVMKANELLPQ